MNPRRAVLFTLLGLAAVGSCAGRRIVLDKGPARGTLVVELHGIRSAEGRIRIALYGRPEGFPSDPDLADSTYTFAITADSLAWRVEDLPTGNWAVAVLHDEDDDGEMDTGWLGRPAEGWGASNHAKGRFGPPSFEDAAIEVDAGETVSVIHLNY
jgi:uncharacterized protein (DUF2141 family)